MTSAVARSMGGHDRVSVRATVDQPDHMVTRVGTILATPVARTFQHHDAAIGRVAVRRALRRPVVLPVDLVLTGHEHRGPVRAREGVVVIALVIEGPIVLAMLLVGPQPPVGRPTPSPDDLHLTATAIAAGRLLDIEVLDHIVVGRTGYVSLRDHGIAFETLAPGHHAGSQEIG